MGVKVASEAGFMKAVVQFAELHSWVVWHDTDSRKNRPGLPDLLLVRRGVFVAAELKTATGKVRPMQAVWLAELERVAAAAGGAVVVRLWRDTPAGWRDIREVLG